MKMTLKAILFGTLLVLSLAVMGTAAFAADVQPGSDTSFVQGGPVAAKPGHPRPAGVTWEE